MVVAYGVIVVNGEHSCSEVINGAVHRFIFCVFVGLVAELEFGYFKLAIVYMQSC